MNKYNTKNFPGITVGIPYHAGDNPEYLKQSVDSILGQTYLPDCIHLIQDGPVSNELAQLAAEYAQKQEQVQCLVIPRNEGLAYVLNYSILRTSTCYYARMDADDIAHPQRIQKQLEYMESHPDIDILGTGAWEFAEDPWQEKCFLKQMPADNAGIEALFHYRNPLVHPSVMFRRQVFARIGLYDANYRTEQDIQLWARALRMQVGITNLQEPLLYFRIHGVVNRRSESSRVLRQFKARFAYNTWSPRLNGLKLAALVFRVMPVWVREWGYKTLR